MPKAPHQFLADRVVQRLRARIAADDLEHVRPTIEAVLEPYLADLFRGERKVIARYHAAEERREKLDEQLKTLRGLIQTADWMAAKGMAGGPIYPVVYAETALREKVETIYGRIPSDEYVNSILCTASWDNSPYHHADPRKPNVIWCFTYDFEGDHSEPAALRVNDIAVEVD